MLYIIKKDVGIFQSKCISFLYIENKDPKKKHGNRYKISSLFVFLYNGMLSSGEIMKIIETNVRIFFFSWKLDARKYTARRRVYMETSYGIVHNEPFILFM